MTRRRSLIAALVVLALAFITLDFRDTAGPVGALQRGSDAVFAPIQAGFASVVRPIGGFFSSIFEIGTLRSRLEALQAENDELRRQGVSIADLQRRLNEAEALLQMARREELQVVGARVIAAPPGTFERELLIDVGAAEGVSQGMAVINSRGVVGKVVEVTTDRARVALLTSVTEGGFAVRAVTETFASPGLLNGQGSGLLRLEMLDSNVVVPLDAQIVTISSQNLPVPGGLPIGLIEPPPDGDTEGERFLSIRPFVDFSNLSTLGVVIYGPEDDAEFGQGETIDTQIVPAPRVTREPDPNAAAVPGVDFPAPTQLGSEEASPSPSPSP